MDRPPSIDSAADQARFRRQIDASVARKRQAQRQPERIVWSGLSMMGLVGWSVTVPTLLGAALGIWLDRRYAGTLSWTLTLMVGGLALGCWNAWHWVARESRDDQRHGGGDD